MYMYIFVYMYTQVLRQQEVELQDEEYQQALRRDQEVGLVRPYHNTALLQGVPPGWAYEEWRSKSEICPICFESHNHLPLAARTPCGHYFHSKCLNRALTGGQEQCPFCRRSLTSVPRREFPLHAPSDVVASTLTQQVMVVSSVCFSLSYITNTHIVYTCRLPT